MISSILFPLLPALALASPSQSIRQTPSLPAGCTDQPLSYPIENFTFFNSTANLDCNNRPPGAQVCWRGDVFDPKSVCDPGTDSTCVVVRPCSGDGCVACASVCATGVPDTPAGFGPPDYVRFSVADFNGEGSQYDCFSKNPGTPGNIRSYAVGGGRVECGGPREAASFIGSSEDGSGTILVTKTRACQGASYYFTYRAAFDLDCSFDAGRNATCTGPEGGLVGALSNITPA